MIRDEMFTGSTNSPVPALNAEIAASLRRMHDRLERAGIDEQAVRESMVATFMDAARADAAPEVSPFAEIDGPTWAECLQVAANERLLKNFRPIAFKQDNPGGKWLEEERMYARSKGRGEFGEPNRFGAITGSFSGDILVPVAKLAMVPGMRGEQSRVRQHDLDWLTRYMQEHGRLPPMRADDPREDVPFVMVAPDGEPWINEGNHRIMAAVALQWNYLPVSVRFFSGGEQYATDWSPDRLIADHEHLSIQPRLGTPRYHRAWHGSPHEFEQFSTEHVGNGEGSQAYGWGLYFASDRGVAEWYQNKFSHSIMVMPDGKRLKPGADLKALYPNAPEPWRAVVGDVLSHGASEYALLHSVRMQYEAMRYGAIGTRLKRARELRKAWKQLKTAPIQFEYEEAKLYEVEIAPGDDNYLDWDVPLAMQSEAVQQALASADVSFTGTNSTGEAVYLDVVEAMRIGAISYDRGQSSEEKASRYLASLGIPGIRYLDGNSRGRGEGNHNYVIFDDDLVTMAAVSDPTFGAVDVGSANFTQWFGASKVVDGQGKPLRVFRGEHGPLQDNGGPSAAGTFRSRYGALSFGDADTASFYASEPNDSDDTAEAPTVYPVYLKIENPVVNTPGDPFIELGAIATMLGEQEARRIALKFAGHIENTNNWTENFAGYGSVGDALADGRLNDLYFMAYPLFDDPDEVAKFMQFGYDGAIHDGSGRNAGETEYKVFSREQVKSAISNTGDFDAENSDIRYSFVFSDFVGMAPDALRGEIDKRFGASFTQKLVDTGAFRLLHHEHELPQHLIHPRGGIAGVYDDITDKTYLVAERIKPEMVRSMLLHEVGVHYGMTRMLGDRAQKLFAQARDLVHQGNPAALAAFRRVPPDTNPAIVDEEILAYMVGDYVNRKMSVVQKAVSKMKVFLFELGADLKLNPADMTVLAQGCVEHVANGGKRPVFSFLREAVDLARRGMSAIANPLPKRAPDGLARYAFVGQGAANADRSLLAEAFAMSRPLTDQERGRYFDLEDRHATLLEGEKGEYESLSTRVDVQFDLDLTRQRTGWFEGYDGKWRFEIDDSAAALKLPDGVPKGLILADAINFVQTGGGQLSLGDVLDHPCLYAAYPALADVRLGLHAGDGDAAYDGGRNEITIGALSNRGDELSVLLHEVQHAIQFIEGFAIGGRVSNFTLQSNSFELFNEVHAEYFEIKTAHPELVTAWEAVRDNRYRVAQTHGVKVFDESGRPDETADRTLRKFMTPAEKAENSRLVGIYADALERSTFRMDFPDVLRRMHEAGMDQNGRGSVRHVTARDQYTRLAGEIEARDVQARLHLRDNAGDPITALQSGAAPESSSGRTRRTVPPYTSQGISREDVIIRFGSAAARSQHQRPSASTCVPEF